MGCFVEIGDSFQLTLNDYGWVVFMHLHSLFGKV
jgi:hypothetical protein